MKHFNIIVFFKFLLRFWIKLKSTTKMVEQQRIPGERWDCKQWHVTSHGCTGVWSPLCTMKTSAEVLLGSNLRYHHLVYYNNDRDQQLIDRRWKIMALALQKNQMKSNKDNKTKCIHVFGSDYCQIYSSLITHQSNGINSNNNRVAWSFV